MMLSDLQIRVSQWTPLLNLHYPIHSIKSVYMQKISLRLMDTVSCITSSEAYTVLAVYYLYSDTCTDFTFNFPTAMDMRSLTPSRRTQQQTKSTASRSILAKTSRLTTRIPSNTWCPGVMAGRVKTLSTPTVHWRREPSPGTSNSA